MKSIKDLTGGFSLSSLLCKAYYSSVIVFSNKNHVFINGFHGIIVILFWVLKYVLLVLVACCWIMFSYVFLMVFMLCLWS